MTGFIASLIVSDCVHAATARIADAQLCDRAARIAAGRFGVPVNVLKAITRTETGRATEGRLQPWPWTVNMEGRGVWFASPQEALNFVRRHMKRGARSFDVGCFQINFKWHGAAFRSVDDMFDPSENAAYAAKFLEQLHNELGEWSLAAGAFHSRTPEKADRYTRRFERIRAALPGNDDSFRARLPSAGRAAKHPAGDRTKPLPPWFSTTGVSRSPGSLVPVSVSPARRGALVVMEKRTGFRVVAIQ